MIYPARILFGVIGVHRDHSDQVISALHEAGVMELKPIKGADGKLLALVQPNKRSHDTAKISEIRSFVDHGIEALSGEKPEKCGMISGMLKKPDKRCNVVKQKNISEVEAEVSSLNDFIHSSVVLYDEVVKISERITKLEAEKEAVHHLLPYGFDLSLLCESEFLSVRAGVFEKDESDMLDSLLEGISYEDCIYKKAYTDDLHVIVIASLRTVSENIDHILKKLLFKEIVPEYRNGTPEQVIEKISKDIESLELRKHEILAELNKRRDKHLEELLVIKEELAVLRQKTDVVPVYGSVGDLVVLQGYVQEKDIVMIEKVCETESSGHSFCNFTLVEENDENAPVEYDHPAWLSPFSRLTSMFATPQYNEVDPTLFLAPVLVISFGIMLGDIGYGLLLALSALLLLRGAGSVPGVLHDYGKILFACGISGAFFGVFEGGFFGDLPFRFFGVQNPFAFANPLNDPIFILQAALVFGIIHLNAGLFIAVFQNIKSGQKKEAFYEQGLWFIIQPCAAVLISGFFGWYTFPESVLNFSLAVAFAAIVMLILHEGPLGFFSLTGFLGDWLSYSRILALALATGGIAMAINIITEMIADINPLLLFFAVPFCICAHFFNFLLQALGGFIHSIRLQYVEFFGKFFKGGGRRFSPFASRRKHTIVERGESW